MAQRKFIHKAIKKPGALHKQMHVAQGKKIPKAKLEAAAKKGSTKEAKRARLALTLRKINRKRSQRSNARKTSR